MTTNLLSVIEQQQKALKLCRNWFIDELGFTGRHPIVSDASAAIAAGKQALEQTQALTEDEFCALQYCEQMLAQIESGKARRSDEAHFQDFRAATIKDASRMAGAALKRVSPVFSRLMNATHPQVTEPHAQAPEIHQLMARAKMDSSLHEMSLATIQALQDVSTEYNAWIRFHSAGGDYDDFLKQYGAFNE